MRLGPEAIWRREARVMWASLAGGGKRGGLRKGEMRRLESRSIFLDFFFKKKIARIERQLRGSNKFT